MSDHASGPRAMTDPVVDITDMYAFPSPQRPGVLALVMNVFPFTGPSALFSDAVDYRFRLRSAAFAPDGAKAFSVGEKEISFTCRFTAPSRSPLVQEGTCTVSTGQSVSFRVNDEQGGQAQGLRVFAGVRLDPFFFDGGRMAMTMKTRKLSFEPVGHATVFRQNVLAIVVEVEVASVLADLGGPLVAVVSETARTGPITVRLERFGRPEIKNFLLLLGEFDLRDLFNQEDAFRPSPGYHNAFRTRSSANLAFLDGLDGKTDWPLDASGIHPLADLLMADFMVVDVSKPFVGESYFEIEGRLLKGEPNQTCGGRSLNEDSIDRFLTILINNDNGPRISDGVDQATVPASNTFPYLAPPEMHPPALQLPSAPTK
jgi:hypothetical protein